VPVLITAITGKTTLYRCTLHSVVPT